MQSSKAVDTKKELSGRVYWSLLDSVFSKSMVDAVYIKLLKGKEQAEISTGKYIWIK